jgi:hypothetical protein
VVLFGQGDYGSEDEDNQCPWVGYGFSRVVQADKNANSSPTEPDNLFGEHLHLLNFCDLQIAS